MGSRSRNILRDIDAGSGGGGGVDEFEEADFDVSLWDEERVKDWLRSIHLEDLNCTYRTSYLRQRVF
jgi:hypothetical protein